MFEFAFCEPGRRIERFAPVGVILLLLSGVWRHEYRLFSLGLSTHSRKGQTAGLFVIFAWLICQLPRLGWCTLSFARIWAAWPAGRDLPWGEVRSFGVLGFAFEGRDKFRCTGGFFVLREKGVVTDCVCRFLFAAEVHET